MSEWVDSRGPQAFLTDRENVIKASTSAVGAVKPVSAAEVARPEPVVRGGAGDSSGVVRVAGDYESDGVGDNLIVDIVSGGATAQVGEPEFIGRGDAEMTGLTVDASTPAQQIIAVLTKRDESPSPSTATIQGFEIEARDTGNKRIEIKAVYNYTQSAMPIAILLNPLAADQSESDKADHNFGALGLTARGDYDPLTQRIQFDTGGPKVYRQYLDNRQGKDWIVYDPPIVRDLPIGTLVYSVTGTADVTVDDGVNPPELFPGISTYFELFSALLNSALVNVKTPITLDRRPGGIAVTDIDIQSEAVILSVTTEAANNESTDRLAIPDDLAVNPTATTATITAKVVDAKPGAEVFEWSDGASVLGQSTAGQTATFGGVTATFPVKAPVVNQTSSEVDIVNKNFAASREAGATVFPDVCFKGGPGVGYMIGPNLSGSLTLTFTYRPRPSDECDCDNADVTGRLDPACLNLDPSSFPEGVLLTDYTAEALPLVQSVSQWARDVKCDNASVRLNAVPAASSTAISDNTPTPEMLLYELIEQRGVLAAVDLANLPPALQNGGPGTKDGPTAWQDAFTKIQNLTVIGDIITSGGSGLDSDELIFLNGLRNVINGIWDHAYYEMNLSPKGNAISQGLGWWRDRRNSFRWEVTDGDGQVLGWLDAGFTWYSARREFGDDRKEQFVDSLELALHLKISCFGAVAVDDSFQVVVNGADVRSNWTLDDLYRFVVLGSRPVVLSGGVDGGFTRTFSNRGTVAGVLEDYILDLNAPAPFSSALLPGFGYLIDELETEIEIGDQFIIDVNRNQFRVSVDGGVTFSTPADIPISPATAPVVFPPTSASVASTITLEFLPGVGVGFNPADQFEWNLIAPYGIDNVKSINAKAHRVDGALNRTLLFGSAKEVSIVAVISTGDVTVELFNGAGSVSPPTLLSGGRDPAFLALPAAVTADRLVITSPDFTGHSLRWAFAAEPFQVMTADNVEPVRRRVQLVGAGVNPSEQLIGLGYGATVRWSLPTSQGALTKQGLKDLRALMDYLSESSEPLVFIPNVAYDDAFLVRWATDDFSDVDRNRYNRDAESKQVMAATVEFAPLIAA